MFTDTLKTDVELWRTESPKKGYTVRSGQGGFYVYKVGYDSPVAHCGAEVGAWKVAYALAQVFPVK